MKEVLLDRDVLGRLIDPTVTRLLRLKLDTESNSIFHALTANERLDIDEESRGFNGSNPPPPVIATILLPFDLSKPARPPLGERRHQGTIDVDHLDEEEGTIVLRFAVDPNTALTLEEPRDPGKLDAHRFHFLTAQVSRCSR